MFTERSSTWALIMQHTTLVPPHAPAAHLITSLCSNLLHFCCASLLLKKSDRHFNEIQCLCSHYIALLHLLVLHWLCGEMIHVRLPCTLNPANIIQCSKERDLNHTTEVVKNKTQDSAF